MASKCSEGFKATQGCQDPRMAARVPTQDQDCSYVPGIYESGYCECEDEIPRFISCGVSRGSCASLCASAPKKSTLHGVDDDHSTGAQEDSADDAKEETPFYMQSTFIGIVVVTFLIVVHQLTRPSTHQRRQLKRLLEGQRQESRVQAQIEQMLQQR